MALPTIQNLYTSSTSPHDQQTGETISTLLSGSSFRLEHICSHGDCSPPNHWYDQKEEEWVALLKGTATIEFEAETLELKEGDALLLPAHLKHRVAATSSDAIWIALFSEFQNSQDGQKSKT